MPRVFQDNPEYAGKWGNTPLILAAADQDLETVRQLIEAGAEVNVKNDFGSTALKMAIDTSGVDPEANVAVMYFLIDHGADINTQDIHGETVLMRACYHNIRWLVKLLIEKGADVNLRRPDGTTAISSLLEASPSLIKKRKTVLKLLQEAGGVE